jgi:hypothetical protein
MKIIFKVNEDGNICLYDTRSEQFFKGCCVRSEELGKPLLDLANNVVKKPYKAILELAQSFVYQDNGYLECMIAKKYVELNPDIVEKVVEKLNKPKVDKKMQLKKKERKKSTVSSSNTTTKKRGRPRKVA